MPSFAAIICAAGSSSRMRYAGAGGIKKEYRLLPERDDGLTVLGAAVSAFAAVSAIQTIVITVPDDAFAGEAAARKALPPQLLEGSSGIHFIPGGPTRQASVYNGLRALEKISAPDFVLIHDGARPFVSSSLIMRIIDAAHKNRAVIPLTALTETPKKIDAPLDGDGTVFISQHLKRDFVRAAQTPQGFAFPEILAAHAKLAAQNDVYTDDAEVWAAFYGPVAAIAGETENRKITFPEDL